MLYLIFPVAIILTLALLVARFYRGPSRINDVFDEYRRPAALRRLVRLWFGLIIAVFLTVQFTRIPFFKYLGWKVTHLSSAISSPLDLLHTFGLLILALAELVIIWQWSHYITQCWRGIASYKLPYVPPVPDPAPSVAVFIPACDEDPEILRRSLSTAARLRYPNVSVWLVENSRTPALKESAARIAQECGVNVLHVRNRGNKGRALNDAMAMLNPVPDYLAVLDADQKVQPNFLEQTVPIMTADDRIAYVQTAQLYENVDSTLVCRAAAQQETLHYDTILEGKGAVGMAMCCGTNFVMRWKALESVGRWDEESITEDMATSFKLHLYGWKSCYYRRVFAVGVGPLNLSAYWKQHRRWSIGGTTVLMHVLRAIFTRKPRPVPARIAVEYLWSSGFYAMTLALAALATLPILLLLFVRLGTGQGLAPTAHLRPIEWVYLSVYPFYVAIMLFPFIHMKLRGYRLRHLLMVQGIMANTVPVYLSGVIAALRRRIPQFAVTPKTGRTVRINLWKKPQPYIMLGLTIVGSILIDLLLRGRVSPVAWIVLFWCYFYVISFGHLLIYTLFNTNSGNPQIAAIPESHLAAAPSVRSSNAEEKN